MRSRLIDLALLAAVLIVLVIAGLWVRQRSLRVYTLDTDYLGTSNGTPNATSLDQWIADLASSDPTVRIRATQSLAAAGSPAVTGLCTALQQEDPIVRRYAAMALRRSNPPAFEAVPTLIDRLTDEDTEVVGEVLAPLGYFGAKSAEAIPAIAPIVDHADASLRIAVVECLGRIGEAAVPVLYEKLRDIDSATQLRIAIELSQFPNPTEDIARVLCERLPETGDPIAFKEISAALCRIGEIAVPMLVEALGSKQAIAREHAAIVLSEIGPNAEAIPALINALKDDQFYVYSAAARALTKAGPGASAAIPALIEAMSAGRGGGITGALIAISSDKDEVVDCFIRALESDGLGLRRESARALGLLGPKAVRSVSALRLAAHDADPQLRLYVAEALWKVDQDIDLALPMLVQTLQEPLFSGAPSLLEEAAATLAEMGARAKPAVPVLKKVIKVRNRMGSTPGLSDALKKIESASAAAGLPDN